MSCKYYASGEYVCTNEINTINNKNIENFNNNLIENNNENKLLIETLNDDNNYHKERLNKLKNKT